MSSSFSSSLFDYNAPDGAGRERALMFLADRDERDWEVLLGYTQLRRFAAGETVITRGERERALYLLMAGTLHPRGQQRNAFKAIEAPSVVGEIAFLAGGGRSVDLVGTTAGELRRLSLDAFEALSARYPEFGRAILFDLGRIAATRLRWMTERAAQAD